ncbi:E3 ubiquitin-protein ligase CHIP [Glycine max]|uniref:RING-type E3 ubiquitin transferase n=1 Tax=Glycine soja TaxID=3848 RepID=A0A445GFZ9_GLYSO|nr:E3 ubiquitin-protein ligase CHIP [Glycine max]RZB60159.1 E3 ubiquitin-protein ligase CHIP isoform B [Glycine soja]
MGPNAAAAKQAEKLRIDGNTYFKKDRFGAAIDAYTEAITLCPNVPVYWTNRALCHLKRNDWERVEEDSRKAIQLDSNSVKAHCDQSPCDIVVPFVVYALANKLASMIGFEYRLI